MNSDFKKSPVLILSFALLATSIVSLLAQKPDVLRNSWEAVYAMVNSNSQYRQIYAEQDRSALIKFSHKYHAEEVGAECADCHPGAKASAVSMDNNLPKMENCSSCHDVEDEENCSLCHLESDSYTAYENPKRELVFSHTDHMTLADMKCETCHNDISLKGHGNLSTLPVMDGCMQCHDGAKASSDCASCHTDIRFIKPADHIPGFMLSHKQIVATHGTANCMMCHGEETCAECHQSGKLHMLKGSAEPIGSMGLSFQGNANTLQQRVHALDYLFVHSMDAKGKTSKCQTCHEPETFCSDCHNNSKKSLRPAWHDAAGFISAGGGFHGKMARKDMESCVSCHQVDGADPTCLRCHTGNGKLK